MGKGDIKTRRGKIAKGTYGVSRPRQGVNTGDSSGEPVKSGASGKGKTKKRKK